MALLNDDLIRFSHMIDISDLLATIRNVMQLKGNKLAAVLGTAEICQLFLFGNKKCHNEF